MAYLKGKSWSGAALAAALSALAIAGPAWAQPAFEPSAANIEADIAFLADDLLEGRLPGTRGYGIAANYVAARLRILGLKPAGDKGSYIQKVPLLSYRAAGEGAITLTGKNGQATPLVFGDDYYPSPSPR